VGHGESFTVPPLRSVCLCVYTAVHINIPALDDTSMTIFMRKLKWMFIALIAPEVVLYTAWQQWYAARRICKKLNKLVCDMGFNQLLEKILNTV
jgi:hypothetical protein